MSKDRAEPSAGVPHAGPMMLRYRHEDYNEDIEKVVERGTERVVEYACKYCPARADDPEEIRHLSPCPLGSGRRV